MAGKAVDGSSIGWSAACHTRLLEVPISARPHRRWRHRRACAWPPTPQWTGREGLWSSSPAAWPAPAADCSAPAPTLSEWAWVGRCVLSRRGRHVAACAGTPAIRALTRLHSPKPSAHFTDSSRTCLLLPRTRVQAQLAALAAAPAGRRRCGTFRPAHLLRPAGARLHRWAGW